MAKAKSRCPCGRVKSQYLDRCNKCQAEYDAVRVAAAQKIVATGKCPDCGRPLRHNLSLAGWYQCSQLGAETHRADPSQPSCEFQTFTV